jgi:hypothetical protein
MPLKDLTPTHKHGLHGKHPPLSQGLTAVKMSYQKSLGPYREDAVQRARRIRIDFKAASRSLRSLCAPHASLIALHDTHMSLQLPHLARLAMNPLAVFVLREHAHLMPRFDMSVALSARSLKIHSI